MTGATGGRNGLCGHAVVPGPGSRRGGQGSFQQGLQFFLGEQGAGAAAAAIKHALLNPFAPVNSQSFAEEGSQPGCERTSADRALSAWILTTFRGTSSVGIFPSATVPRPSFDAVPGGRADACVHGVGSKDEVPYRPCRPPDNTRRV